MPNPCVYNFAINKSCKRQSNTFERSVKSAPKQTPLSIASRYFSTIDVRQCCELKPFPKPHWYLDSISSKYFDICQ